MKHKTHATAPFPLQFKIWDTVTSKFVYASSKKEETLKVFQSEYERVTCPARTSYMEDWSYQHYYHKVNIPRYILFDHFGEEIYERLRRSYTYNFTARPSTKIRYKKGNPDKIKKGYDETPNYWANETGDHVYHHDYITYSYTRTMRTMPERRRNIADANDYGTQIVRGSRRGNNLPDPWDDYPNHAAWEQKSWKRHSKRRHQYKVKT